MDETESFEQVLARLRQHDPDAATDVYKCFAQRLIGQARNQLDPRILQRVDPEDVVQSVFKSVFLRLEDGQFSLGDWDSMWGLLTRVTLHKCLKWVDYFRAQARDIDREVVPASQPNDSSSSWKFLDREPTPPEAAILAESVDRILAGLTDREQQIVALSLQGHEVAEISRQLDCTEAKVYRVRQMVRERLERMRAEDCD